MIKRLGWTLVVVGIGAVVMYYLALWIAYLNTYYPIADEVTGMPGAIDRSIAFPMAASPFIVALMVIWGHFKEGNDNKE